ncbi:MAG: hypothetical protein GKC53_05640 [Neisseriaceae bacterium]|nr:MAG: hypothetical protein GKC53_05640 [Neisseriaceae bacterium]
MIQAQLKEYVGAFYTYTGNHIEDEASKKVYLMSDSNAWTQYKNLYKKFLKEFTRKDKYGLMARVKDINFIDENTAQIRISAIVLPKAPTIEEYKEIESEETSLVEIKFKILNLTRTKKEREYNPIHLVITDLKELD